MPNPSLEPIRTGHGPNSSVSMDDSLGLRDFLVAISRMPEDKRVCSTRVWYESQKEHWIGWLLYYRSPGAYGRQVTDGRDAKFVYNHVVCPDLLLFLAVGAGVEPRLVRRAKAAARGAGKTQMAQAGAIRRVLPWSIVLQALMSSGLLPRNAF